MRLRPFKFVGVVGAAVVAALQSGCNSSSTNDNNSNPTDQSATGVWTGTDSVSGQSVTALINSAGTSAFIRSDGIVFTGPAQVSGSNLVVAVDGYPDFPSTFTDGSDYGIGTLSGTVSTGATLSASLTFTTNNNTAITGDWSLNYEALSDSGSSTAAIAGTYTDSVTGATISILSSGAVSSSTTANGCVLSGSVSTSDSAHDVYEVAYSYANCTGTYQVLNGVQFTGLAYLNTNLSPAQVTIAATGASATDKYGIISTLNGS
jgi:hypothetical protein